MQGNRKNDLNAQYQPLKNRPADRRERYPNGRPPVNPPQINRIAPGRTAPPFAQTGYGARQSNPYRQMPTTGQNLRVQQNTPPPQRQNSPPRQNRSTPSRPVVKQYKKRGRNPFFRDFLLGLGIGFAVFGTAAIFVVRAVIGIFIQ